MPNWCDNSLTITTKVDPKQFLTLMDNGHYSVHFNKLMPIEDHSIISAYNHRGTKRDVYHKEDGKDISEAQVQIETDEDGVHTIMTSFDTAWSPPTKYYKFLYALLKRSDNHTHIEAYYNEGGVGFLGSWIDGDENTMDYYGIHWIEELDLYIIEDGDKREIRDELNEEACIPEDIPAMLEEYMLLPKTIKKLIVILSSYNKKHVTKNPTDS